MRRRNLILGTAAAVALGGCASNPKLRRYDGPEVTFVVVNKAARRMHLLHHDRVLTSYDINLGFAPVGHKQFEGDGRTPEGLYRIDRRNPNSSFHLSLGISYPNVNDVAAAKSMGKSAGGDIFIHGQKNPFRKDDKDWTWGCISVTNDEIEDIYAMVRDGTLITLNA
ncbi:L,D-transpeptidase family protein [Roseobacter sp. YSTF-M11]|uniref:L,D-transpeptidase family protein n=1 Tax=Roseobacter insulae TaxID=2859783 RepID=A0A9X1FS75_9RHOB|nr:L,D-transpeptidase family protein [Roseobacter insulae]MBW4706745.1 L,D-transpeptidase family protein [Roseobacter insulae]